MKVELIPETAPFSVEQRAWLNGFLSGMLGILDHDSTESNFPLSNQAWPPSPTSSSEAVQESSDSMSFPWHDATLDIQERLQRSEGQAKPLRLMSAMAQLNCGTCGYLCQTYAQAIADGTEKSLTLCTPGGSATVKALRSIVKETGSTTDNVPPPQAEPITPEQATIGTRSNPVLGTLIESRRLNGPESVKDTRHVIIDWGQAGLSYRAGDAMGVYPENCPSLVRRVADAAGVSIDDTVSIDGKERTIGEWLRDCCLRNITTELIEIWTDHCSLNERGEGSPSVPSMRDQLLSFADSDEALSLDVFEFMERFAGVQVPPARWIGALQPLQPRLYSIASSPSRHPTSVHLTVGRVESNIRGRSRLGVASTFLSDRLSVGSSLRIFVQPSKHFSIPSDPNRPMIMIGPGTGIAPFMAFLEQREADGAQGSHWLFFGDQHEKSDFLYRERLENWQRSGLLTRLSLAFSRDQAEKRYVQHCMTENREEFFQWLERGASVYVCGDAKRMAVDVERALCEIVTTEGRRSVAEAKHYIDQLRKDGRYQKDVY